MRTRLSICRRKRRFASAAGALAAGGTGQLRAYRCDRCGQFHLTSRRKGKRVPRPDRVPAEVAAEGPVGVPAGPA